MINKLNDQQYEKFKELFPRTNAAIEEVSNMGNIARDFIYIGTTDFLQTLNDLNLDLNAMFKDVIARAACLMLLRKTEIEICSNFSGSVGIIVNPDKLETVENTKCAVDKDIYVAAQILADRNLRLRPPHSEMVIDGFIPVNNIVPDNFMRFALDENMSCKANSTEFINALENFDSSYLLSENQLNLDNVKRYILHDKASDQQAADMFYGLYRAFKTTKSRFAAFAVICFEPGDDEGTKTKTILVVNGSADIDVIAKDIGYIADYCQDGFVDNNKILGFECESKYAQLIPLSPVK